MEQPEQTFILIMIAYFVLVLLSGILVYFDIRSAGANSNSIVQRTEANPGLKALEIIMGGRNNFTSGEIVEILQYCCKICQKDIVIPRINPSMGLTIIFIYCITMYYLALIELTTNVNKTAVSGASFRASGETGGPMTGFGKGLATGEKNKKGEEVVAEGLEWVAVEAGGVEEVA